MTPLRAEMVLRCHVYNYQIDNGDDYGPHFPLRGEVRQAARVLRGCGGPKFANFRQMLAWAESETGENAILDADNGEGGAS